LTLDALSSNSSGMKKQKKYQRTFNTVEVVTAFPGREGEAAEDGLFDDCPHCQELRRLQKSGIVKALEEWEARQEN